MASVGPTWDCAGDFLLLERRSLSRAELCGGIAKKGCKITLTNVAREA
jgi:hypothetical protein